jgi:hypothetical protein
MKYRLLVHTPEKGPGANILMLEQVHDLFRIKGHLWPQHHPVNPVDIIGIRRFSQGQL